MLETKALVKNYHNQTVLDNIDIKISEQSITSIIGPNGAGKSTLLGLLSRTISRDSGDVLLSSKDILNWNRNELSKQISILKQSGHIASRITVRDLVEFGRYPYSKGKLKNQDNLIIDNALDYMDLRQLEDRFIDELSGGQRQRVYIASLIAQDTKYILLDEPLNNLDMKYTSDLLKILRRLVTELQKTVVIVIHDINIAASFSDNIVLLKDGEIYIHDKVENVMREDVLEQVYQMDFKVRDFEGRKICIYY